MNAEIKPNYDPNRQKLADIVPLSTPFTVYIEPTRYCNFRCFYCMRGIPQAQNDLHAMQHMPFDLYKLTIDQLKTFPQKLKRIILCGMGEPLMNPLLPEMIEYAKKANVAESIDMYTNASLLTPETTDRLIAAGISKIMVAVQGLDSEKYQEVCGVKIDFDIFLENISYFYNHKKDCKVYIKIIDILLTDQKDKEVFFKTFGDICDQIYIEHLYSSQPSTGDLNGLIDNTRNVHNKDYKPAKVCPIIFYHLMIDSDGDVYPCSVVGLPKYFSIGNINGAKLTEIWNGNVRKQIIREHLKMNREKIDVCKNCFSYATNLVNDHERVDEYAEKLLPLFEISSKEQ